MTTHDFHSRCILLVIISIANVIAGHAQIVTGKIFDQESKPVSSAYIVATDKNASQFTALCSDNGSFSINLKVGDYTVCGYYFGTVLFETEIEVEQDTDMGTITVEPSISIEEVIVRGNRPLLRQVEDRLVFDVQNLSGITRYKAEDVLKYVPRVIVGPNGALSVGGQSATIFVDDRQLSADEATLFIRSMDAKDIKQIEVQTMRSGDQAADITGGVIHIKTMSARMGLSGSVSIYASSPKKSYYHIFPGVNIFYGKERWNVYGSYSYSNARELQYSETINDYPDSGNRHTTTNNYISNQNQNSFKIGSMDTLSKNHSLGVEFSGNINNPRDDRSEGNVRLYQNNDLVDVGVSSSVYSTYSNFKNLAAIYTWEIDTLGSTLKLLGNYNYKKANSNNEFNTEYESLNDINEINLNSVSANSLSAKGDLRKNWANNWSLRAGFHFLGSNRISDLEVETQYPQELSSTRWDLTENISSGYLGFSKMFPSNFFVYMNLRAENTDIRGIISDSDEDFRKNYLDFFPYIFFSRQVNGN